MKTISIHGETYPAIKAENLQNGLIYWDGSEIHSVQFTKSSVKFVLDFDGGSVERMVRKNSMIALANQQIAVFM